MARIKQYKKGFLSITDKQYLMNNADIAIGRAKKQNAYNNPSTTIYKLLEDLDKLMMTK